MRRFELWRVEDETGVSGTGHVASGVMFVDGQCVMRWNTETTSTATYRSIEDLEHIHGHGGKTKVFWLDDRKYDHMEDRDVELVGICLQCFGGPYDEQDGKPGRYNHCFDCGAHGYCIFVPRYAVEAIRKKDKQRCETSNTKSKELRLLRARLPVPDFVVAKKLTPPDWMTEEELAEERKRLGEDRYKDQWTVSLDNTSMIVEAKTKEEARAEGARKLSWLTYLE